jgi:UDP-N-acetylglucosamine transferase subunit ALG13
MTIDCEDMTLSIISHICPGSVLCKWDVGTNLLHVARAKMFELWDSHSVSDDWLLKKRTKNVTPLASSINYS